MDEWCGLSAGHREASTSGLVTGLLACGIAVAVLQISADVVAALRFPGYSYLNQAVSELSAIGAPTRPFLAVVGFLYEALVLAFAVGVWKTAGTRRALRITAGLLGLFALNAFVWAFFPMQPRGSALAATDVGHIIGAIAQVVTMVLFIVCGSGAGGNGFRVFSMLMIAAILGGGLATASQSAGMAEGLPTPLLGLFERLSFYGPSVWILALSLVLLRSSHREQAPS